MKFPFFGVPVSVHWSFLIVAFFGVNRFDSAAEVGGWTLAVFVAVLLHEAGHAFTARAYGSADVAITLFALGGYTSWVPKPSMGPGKRFLVSAAGSAVGIAVGLIILWLGRQGSLGGMPDWALAFFETFILVGLFWGVLNWIPMLPLDGGHMLQHALTIFTPRYADRLTLGISAVVGVGLVGAAFYFGQTFLAIFLVFILLSGLRSLPGSGAVPPRRRDAKPPPTESDQEPPAFPI
jgi:Zn-dependent protease